MELPSLAHRAERHQALHSFLQEFARSRGDDSLAWIALPNLSAGSRPGVGDDFQAQAPLNKSRARSVVKKSAAAADQAIENAGYRAVGDCASCAGSLNQRRSQDPAFEKLGWEETAVDPKPPRRRMRRLAREAVEFADDLTAALGEAGIELAVRSSTVYRHSLRWATQLAAAEALVEKTAPKLAVIGSTPSAPARALVFAARQAGLPSAYVPHAPSSGLMELEDLPTDFAFLRGKLEIEHFAAHGVDAKRLDVGGNPTLSEQPAPDLDGDALPVVALSPFAPEIVTAIMEVAGAALDSAVIASHPRMARELVEALCPDGWRIADVRTYELLKDGPPMVIQFSSGIALESLHLGLPTIELAFPGAVAPPYIKEPYVHRASSSEELKRAVAESRADGADAARRERILEWGRGWSSPNGDEAAGRVAELLASAAAGGVRGPIWDAWTPDGGDTVSPRLPS